MNISILFYFIYLFYLEDWRAVLCCALRENEKEMERKGFGFWGWWVPGRTRHRIDFSTLSCLQSPLWNGGMDSKRKSAQYTHDDTCNLHGPLWVRFVVVFT